MATTPDPVGAEVREQSTADLRQHVADLRTELQCAMRYVAFSAGRESASDPKFSDMLMEVADRMEAVLKRTSPE